MVPARYQFKLKIPMIFLGTKTKHSHFNFKVFLSLSGRGQFLVESMVAIGIITVGLLGILALLSSALSLNRVVSDQYRGIYLASEGIEVVKSIIDKNTISGIPWNSGFSAGSFSVEYSSDSLSSASGETLRFANGIYSYAPGGTPTTYGRVIRIQLIGSDEMRVNSTVSWITRGGGSFSVNLEDTFFNRR